MKSTVFWVITPWLNFTGLHGVIFQEINVLQYQMYRVGFIWLRIGLSGGFL
jgi:hypothetical protein